MYSSVDNVYSVNSVSVTKNRTEHVNTHWTARARFVSSVGIAGGLGRFDPQLMSSTLLVSPAYLSWGQIIPKFTNCRLINVYIDVQRSALVLLAEHMNLLNHYRI